jgi:hypothetical protein
MYWVLNGAFQQVPQTEPSIKLLHINLQSDKPAKISPEGQENLLYSLPTLSEAVCCTAIPEIPKLTHSALAGIKMWGLWAHLQWPLCFSKSSSHLIITHFDVGS